MMKDRGSEEQLSGMMLLLLHEDECSTIWGIPDPSGGASVTTLRRLGWGVKAAYI